MKKIILASNSPRRKEILLKNNIDFNVLAFDCAEVKERNFNIDNLTYNSKIKAYVTAKNIKDDVLIIAADTVVIFENICLFKPRNIFEAVLMLKKLSGKTHKVMTSHTIIDNKKGVELTEISTTYVEFRKINLFEIIQYIIFKNPLDKAGSYGIQDFLSEENYTKPPKTSFITKILGSYYNVVGLDIDLVKKMLLNF